MNKKTFLIGAGLVLVVLLGGVGWWKLSNPKPKERMEEIRPEWGDIQLAVSATGTVEPQNRLEIKPPIGGRIDTINVREGEACHKGQILALMSSTERAALLDAARMKDPGELQYWEDAYKATPIIASLNGRIIVRGVEPGQTVTVNDTLFVLSDRLMVKANVDETDIGSVAVGQHAVIQLDAYPDVKVPGRVDHISYESTVINNVTVYTVEIAPEKVPEVFRSGMSANLEIVQSRKEHVLKIPLTAVQEENGRTMVLVKTNDPQKPFQPRPIRLGISDLTHAEVLEGLTADDVVIVISQTQEFKKEDSSSGKSPFMPTRPRGSRGH